MQGSPQGTRKTGRRWSGLGQLSLVEHSLCPLDSGLLHWLKTSSTRVLIFTVDKNHHMQPSDRAHHFAVGAIGDG